MAARQRVSKVMTQPIVQLFRFLQSKTPVEIWLYENTTTKLQGRIIGFDEYMNVVLDNAEEVDTKKKSTVQLGRILLKGDNITMVTEAAADEE